MDDLASPTFSSLLSRRAAETEALLDSLLPAPAESPSPRLAETMRYAVLGGGKRLRPFLTVESALMLGAPFGGALRVAAAIECMHCYSLIHDDLPAFDDDATRRGRPSAHAAFGEATAILAGDALQAFAFEIVCSSPTHASGEVRSALATRLAEAVGASGMCAGQALDMEASEAGVSLEWSESDVSRLQALKTGALFRACVECGAISAQADSEVRRALRRYADALGAAFQIRDDLLDALSDSSEVGKSTGKDAAAGKATFVAALGIDGARSRAERMRDEAIAALDFFGESAASLRAAAEYTVSRAR